MEASVLVMKCGLSRNTFGVRIQKMRDGDWYRTWAFKLNDKLAKREGYELQSIVQVKFHLLSVVKGRKQLKLVWHMQCKKVISHHLIIVI